MCVNVCVMQYDQSFFSLSLSSFLTFLITWQGWCGSADPRKRQYEVRHTEAEDMKKEMSEIRYRKDQELMELNSGVRIIIFLLFSVSLGVNRKQRREGQRFWTRSKSNSSLSLSLCFEEENKVFSGVSCCLVLENWIRPTWPSSLVFQVGVELVPLLKEKQTGKPRKDPQTGYLMNHALPSTDVTKIAEAKRWEWRH